MKFLLILLVGGFSINTAHASYPDDHIGTWCDKGAAGTEDNRAISIFGKGNDEYVVTTETSKGVNRKPLTRMNGDKFETQGEQFTVKANGTLQINGLGDARVAEELRDVRNIGECLTSE